MPIRHDRYGALGTLGRHATGRNGRPASGPADRATMPCPRRVEGLEMAWIDDQYVIHDRVRGRVHYLDHMARLVLHLCDGRSTAEAIADTVRKTYDLPAVPLSEVSSILGRLANEGLIS